MAPKRNLPHRQHCPAKRQKALFVKMGQGNGTTSLMTPRRAQQPSSSALSTRHAGPNGCPRIGPAIDVALRSERGAAQRKWVS
ncbi:hypothetical protein CALVIDRAFT_543414 [Calocera viscosa TUFC12733]|uniref:Uncharacterized protein n=1 Tax=Calocera viscosa (strain TUFC12733) TaxID=1330018 RepID=A0A167FLI6_CALVF|nr:hypothetical protein CALVIDRAFT_543414 [Calocera viscosa TUFC12733]